MRSFALLSAFALAMLAVACTSGETAPIDEAGGTEVELRDTVALYADAFLKGDYEEAYDLHTAEWQSRCPLDDWTEFVARQDQGLSDQVTTAGGDMSTARFVVTAVVVDGARGVHQGHVEASGLAYELGDQDRPGGTYWVWRDGRWQATDDRAQPCAG